SVYTTIALGLLVAELGTDEQRADILPRLCAGELVGTLAIEEPRVHRNMSALRTAAEVTVDGRWRLNGTKHHVPHADAADIVGVSTSKRIQFGRPIGSFQAVQHHVANMGLLVEGGALLTTKALTVVAADGPGASDTAARAKAWMSDAYKNVTVLAHQLFGGAG